MAERVITIGRTVGILFGVVLFSILATLGWAIGRVNEEGQQRERAFCGLAFLFDESLRLSGGQMPPDLVKPYAAWKASIGAVDCPPKFRSTTTTTEAP